MSTATAPIINSGDRLALTLFFAAAVHVILILGVSFNLPDQTREVPPTLDVVLVQTRTDETPEKADYLAQANQAGGGEREERVRPRAAFSAPQPQPTQGVAPQPMEESAPPVAAVVTEQPVLTQPEAERETLDDREPQPEMKPKPRVSAETIKRSLEIARLSAEIDQHLEAEAKRPRKKFIHARTREAVAAAYMADWVKKVERVGNLNYPDEARRTKLTGSLVLVVGINANGSVHEVVLRESSGHQLLDDGAKRIVQLAGPFAPFSTELRKETDILYITRTWQFLSSNRLTSR
jgi:protein TonB